MVAPSFQSMPIVKEQYQKDGKWYVDVKNPSTGKVRSVRWYSSQEYAKAYANKSTTSKKEIGDGVDAAYDFYYTDEGHSGLKEAMGFSKGPILVIRNDKSYDQPYLESSIARYAVGIGWYIPSTETLPSDIPSHFKYLLLSWDEFKLDETHSKKPTVLAEFLRERASRQEYVRFEASPPANP